MILEATSRAALRKTSLILLAALAAASCASNDETGPGTGWSRAPDLSVYSALNHFGAVAREQSILCAGRTPQLADQEWRLLYAGRHDRVTSAINARYSAGAIYAARLPAGPRVPCGPRSAEGWWGNYERLLRLLEIRLLEGSAG